MKTSRFLQKSIPACLAMACALSSCVVTWNTGGKIREGTAVCKGFDTLHPVGGKVYIGADGKSYYMQAQEVTYTSTPYLVKTNGTHDPKTSTPTPTGRTAWIEVKPSNSGECPPDIARKTGLREIPYYFSNWDFHKEIGALPHGAKLWSTGETSRSTPTVKLLGNIAPDAPQTTSTATKVLAAPLDYVVDPVLSTTSSAIYTAAVGGGAAAIYVTFGVSTCAVHILTLGLVPTPWDAQRPPPLPSPYDPEKEACIYVEKRGESFMYAYIPRGKGQEMSWWKPTYLPAPYLRKVIDDGVPLVMSIHCRLDASDQEMEARLNAALAPLQAQGIRLHRATAENGSKRFIKKLGSKK